MPNVSRNRTAADLRVVLGEHDRADNNNDIREIREVSDSFPHEEYDATTYDKDIALLKVNQSTLSKIENTECMYSFLIRDSSRNPLNSQRTSNQSVLPMMPSTTTTTFRK
jgi:hypothetical protein